MKHRPHFCQLELTEMGSMFHANNSPKANLSKYDQAAQYAMSVLGTSATAHHFDELHRLSRLGNSLADLRRFVDRWTPDRPAEPITPKPEPEPIWEPCVHFKDQPWYAASGTRECLTCQRNRAK